MRFKADVRRCHWFYEFTPQRGQESYNGVAFVIIFAFCYHRERPLLKSGCCHSDGPWPGSGPPTQFNE
jgi:hypothetical protein